MKTLLNIIWLVFAGFWLWLGYLLAGIICCLLIVTIPWGIASFRIAGYALWPFGREVVDKPARRRVLADRQRDLADRRRLLDRDRPRRHRRSPLVITIIGIPMAIANLKLIPVSLMPLGKQIVPSDALLPTYRKQVAAA